MNVKRNFPTFTCSMIFYMTEYFSLPYKERVLCPDHSTWWHDQAKTDPYIQLCHYKTWNKSHVCNFLDRTSRLHECFVTAWAQVDRAFFFSGRKQFNSFFYLLPPRSFAGTFYRIELFRFSAANFWLFKVSQISNLSLNIIAFLKFFKLLSL